MDFEAILSLLCQLRKLEQDHHRHGETKLVADQHWGPATRSCIRKLLLDLICLLYTQDTGAEGVLEVVEGN